jgi:hypothetical protein
MTEIGAKALKLNEEPRADLLSLLLDGFGGPDPHDAPGGDSLSEAIRRGDELKSGVVTGIPEDEFMGEIRASRGK